MLRLFSLLLERGADVNSKDWYGQTALVCAALKGHREVVKILLANGADVNARTRKGFTPLSLATEQGHHLVADLILEKNPNQNTWSTEPDVAKGP